MQFHFAPIGSGAPTATPPPNMQPMQCNQVIMPQTPQRVDVAKDFLMRLTIARTLYGVDGSTRQRDLTTIEEHTYEVALMTIAQFMKGDEFNERVAVVPVVQPVREDGK